MKNRGLIVFGVIAFVCLCVVSVSGGTGHGAHHNIPVPPKGPAATCDPNDPTIRANRIKVLQDYTTRTNFDLDNYNRVCDTYYTDQAGFIIRGVGSFEPKIIATEYGQVLWPIHGMPPMINLWGDIDMTTLNWNGDTADFMDNAVTSIGWNATSSSFELVVGGLRNHEYITFDPCTSSIDIDYLVNDPEVLAVYNDPRFHPDVASLCYGIMTACTGPLQQYKDVNECINYVTPLNSPCPYPISSNTLACRGLHLQNALINAEVHCPHCGMESPVCVDDCLPTANQTNCNNCAARNATCAVDYPNPSAVRDPIYFCMCNDGFIGDGSTCTAKSCSKSAVCNANGMCENESQYPCGKFGICTDKGICGCMPTFMWNTTTGLCVCPPDTTLRLKAVQGAPMCVPNGKCLDVSDCKDQSWHEVQCKSTPVPNPISPFKACLCNDGFIGGWTNPCTCPKGNKILHNRKIHAKVCAGPGQCTEDYQCGWWQKCVVPKDSGLGTCTPSSN